MLVLDAASGVPCHLAVGGPAPDLAAALAAWSLHRLGRGPGFALRSTLRGLDVAERAPAEGGPMIAGASEGGSALGVPAAPRSVLLASPVDPGTAAAVLDALPEGAPAIVDTSDPALWRLTRPHAHRIVGFGIEGAPATAVPTWLAAPYAHQGGVQPFELFVGGTSAGRVFSPLPGNPSAGLAIGVIAWLVEALGLPSARDGAAGLRDFPGLRGVLERVGTASGVTVVHHAAGPDTSPRLAVEAIRASHPTARVIGVGPEAAGLVGADVIAEGSAASPDELASAAIDTARPGDVVVVTAPDPALVDAVLGALAARAFAAPED